MRFVIVIALSLFLAGCTGGETSTDTPTPTTTTRTTVSGSPVVSTTSTPTPAPTGLPTPTSPAVIVTPTPTPTPPTTPQLSGTRILRIGDYVYEPAHLVVAKGTTVEVQNQHVLSHTVTAENGAFDTANIKQGEDFELPMTVLGTFPYYCKLHPQMRGNITVIEAPAEPTPTTPTGNSTNTSKQSATIFDFDFRPRAPSYPAGTEITWTNTGSRKHTVTSDDGTTFDSGDIPSQGSWTATFAQPGTYAYHCRIHPNMKATITITAA